MKEKQLKQEALQVLDTMKEAIEKGNYEECFQLWDDLYDIINDADLEREHKEKSL